MTYKDITLKQYLEFREGLILNSDNKFYFIEHFEKINVKDVSLIELELLINKYSFLSESFESDENISPVININKGYSINKNFELLSFEQWENLDSIIKSSGDNIFKNIHVLLAITCFEPKEYTYDKAIELANCFLESKMFYIIPNINFFLFKETESLKTFHTYLKKMEQTYLNQAWNILKQIKTSNKSGGGILRWSRLRMIIFCYLIKCWLKRFEKYSHS